MDSSSAQPLLDRLEDGTHDREENTVIPDAGGFYEKSHANGLTVADNNKRRYITVLCILLFLVVFAISSVVYSSYSDAELVEVATEEEIPGKELESDRPSFSLQLKGIPTESFWDNLRNDTLYLTGWIDAGWTNDFMTIVNTLYVAFLSNRTAIVPPFKPAHISSSAGRPAFSEVFDVPRMSKLIPGELPIVDWYEVKDRASNHTDELGCWTAWATPRPDSGPRNGIIPRILHIDPSYTPVPKNTKLIQSMPTELHIRHTALAALTFPDGRRQAHLPSQAPFPGSNGHTKLPDERLACFDFLYYGSGVETYEMTFDFSPAWRFVGTHAHWAPQIIELTNQSVATAFGLSEDQPLPPFISIHVRHGDFTVWCEDKANVTANPDDPGPHSACFAPLSAYVAKVEEVRKELLEMKGVDVQRVLVMSDEKSEEWWKAISDLGWAWIDHKVMQTVEKYGEWYPIFIDAAAQSMGTGFVGTYKSTMSLMGARRVVDWQGGVWREVNWNDFGKDRSVTFTRRTQGLRNLDEFVI